METLLMACNWRINKSQIHGPEQPLGSHQEPSGEGSEHWYLMHGKADSSPNHMESYQIHIWECHLDAAQIMCRAMQSWSTRNLALVQAASFDRLLQ
jgi:hypothetical protein